MWDVCGGVVDEALLALRDEWEELEAVVVREVLTLIWVIVCFISIA
jgi:hypothetical protein